MQTAPNVKNIRMLYNLTQEEFAGALGITRELVNKMEKGKCAVSRATKLLLAQFLDDRKSEIVSHETVSDLLKFAGRHPKSAQPYYVERREAKKSPAAITVPLVGIKAQAGYVRGFEHMDYIDSLEKYSLPPGVNPTGAVWSYFEVDGDSMEPTLTAGDILLASMMPHEDWADVKNFGVYIILTEEQLVVKRVYQKSATEWVLISDNEEGYPQVLLQVSAIKQVWTFRRHIRSRVPQPREFRITA
jgi:phage repressor protein C with HTH and peptisase S24 domain